MSVYNSVVFEDFNLTPKAKRAYKEAHDIAKTLGHLNVNNLHVLYGCFKNSNKELNKLFVESSFFKNELDILKALEKAVNVNGDKFFVTSNSDPWHKEVVQTIKEADLIAEDAEDHFIGVEHILLAIVNTSPYIFDYFDKNESDLIFSTLSDYLFSGRKNVLEGLTELAALAEGGEETLPMADGVSEKQEQEAESESSNLSFVTNLNQLYMENKLPDVYGRELEVSELIETLSKKNKCNAILTGEAGVGKTAIVESLVARICNYKVPANLLGLEVLSVDIGSMLAGTQYRGQFEQKFKSLLEFAAANPFVILFFDEIHNIFGAGGSQEGSLDAANMLKPMLARGDVKCIGATTVDEYEKIFKKDAAIKRRFFNIEIDEPSKESTKQILYNCKEKYEKFHSVKFSKTTIDCIVDLSDSILSHKRFPDKAFDVLDQVGARVKIKNCNSTEIIKKKHKEMIKSLAHSDTSEEEMKSMIEGFLSCVDELESNVKKINIKKQDVIEIIAEHGKVSSEQIVKNKKMFSSFLPSMKEEVFGQDEALGKIEDLLSCAKAGLTEDNKPLASMFFVGPTSVGKTHAAKKIAKNYFGNEKAIIQINMSELYDKTGISKLIGSNSGYVGYEEGGMLTKFVKDNPNCVVLFDEVEKADPQILNLLLHLLDEGYIEDNKHHKIDFSNTIVVLTSNIGNNVVRKKSMGFVQDADSSDDLYMDSVKNGLKPELLARVNDIFVFQDLNKDQLKRIIRHELNRIKNKLKEQNIQTKFTTKTIDCILKDLTKNNLHARDIKKLIRSNVEVPVSKFVVSNSKISNIEIKSIDNKIKVC